MTIFKLYELHKQMVEDGKKEPRYLKKRMRGEKNYSKNYSNFLVKV